MEAANAEKRRLSAQWLTRSVEYYEHQKTQGGGFNILAAQAARDAAIVLGHEIIAARLDQLLAPLTVADLLEGSITNIRKTEDMNRRPLSKSTIEQIALKHPTFGGDYVTDLLSNGGAHLQCCLNRDYEAAFAKAANKYEEAEVALAQALLGDFDLARKSIERFPDRRLDMLVVLAIELYRADQFDQADALMPILLRDDAAWTPIHLALGIADRVPWEIYPFPDY